MWFVGWDVFYVIKSWVINYFGTVSPLHPLIHSTNKRFYSRVQWYSHCMQNEEGWTKREWLGCDIKGTCGFSLVTSMGVIMQHGCTKILVDLMKNGSKSNQKGTWQSKAVLGGPTGKTWTHAWRLAASLDSVKWKRKKKRERKEKERCHKTKITPPSY